MSGAAAGNGAPVITAEWTIKGLAMPLPMTSGCTSMVSSRYLAHLDNRFQGSVEEIKAWNGRVYSTLLVD